VERDRESEGEVGEEEAEEERHRDRERGEKYEGTASGNGINNCNNNNDNKYTFPVRRLGVHIQWGFNYNINVSQIMRRGQLRAGQSGKEAFGGGVDHRGSKDRWGG
jgi:hypothetical protein